MTHALDDLLDALEDVDDATREEAAKTLAELGDPKGLEARVDARYDEDWAGRAHAGRGVAKIGGANAPDAHIAVFNHPIMEVRTPAVDAAVKMGPTVLDPMVAAMKDERGRVR